MTPIAIANLVMDVAATSARLVRGEIDARQADAEIAQAFARYDGAVKGLPGELAANDAAADAELRARFPVAPAVVPIAATPSPTTRGPEPTGEE